MYFHLNPSIKNVFRCTLKQSTKLDFRNSGKSFTMAKDYFHKQLLNKKVCMTCFKGNTYKGLLKSILEVEY